MDPGAQVMDPGSVALVWDEVVVDFLRTRLNNPSTLGPVASYVQQEGPSAVATLHDLGSALLAHPTARGRLPSPTGRPSPPSRPQLPLLRSGSTACPGMNPAPPICCPNSPA